MICKEILDLVSQKYELLLQMNCVKLVIRGVNKLYRVGYVTVQTYLNFDRTQISVFDLV